MIDAYLNELSKYGKLTALFAKKIDTKLFEIRVNHKVSGECSLRTSLKCVYYSSSVSKENTFTVSRARTSKIEGIRIMNTQLPSFIRKQTRNYARRACGKSENSSYNRHED